MSLPSATLALLTSLLIAGCATKEQQPTAAETAPDKKDQRVWSAATEEGIWSKPSPHTIN